ncbi:MAG: hypothetical protein ACRC2K_10845 [Clostridium sp.]
MKLLMLYVEKARVDKKFRVKAACIVATVFAIIGLAANLTNGSSYQEGIMMSLILWMIWYLLWLLFTRQIIRISAKIKERNIRQQEIDKEKEKAEKRRLAEDRVNSKKKKK